jgi:hypothetical protein
MAAVRGLEVRELPPAGRVMVRSSFDG